mmetsp:Transcript_53870/g.145125  ORF Transcript_53870/g.145125 Transcript_53870/m.145125 type:complete len:226 (-) Transcript_53870:278-955(-)
MGQEELQGAASLLVAFAPIPSPTHAAPARRTCTSEAMASWPRTSIAPTFVATVQAFLPRVVRTRNAKPLLVVAFAPLRVCKIVCLLQTRAAGVRLNFSVAHALLRNRLRFPMPIRVLASHEHGALLGRIRTGLLAVRCHVNDLQTDSGCRCCVRPRTVDAPEVVQRKLTRLQQGIHGGALVDICRRHVLAARQQVVFHECVRVWQLPQVRSRDVPNASVLCSCRG